MKKLLLFFTVCAASLMPAFVMAQTPTFTVASDTVSQTVNNDAQIYDDITNTAVTTGMPVKWRVVASDFPADWRGSSALGICDNFTCYFNDGSSSMWNGTTGSLHSSHLYTYNVAGQFDLALSFASVALGTHYITIALSDTATTPYVKNITFWVTKAPAGVPNVTNSEEKVLLYPNPAKDEINVVFDANAEIKNIAVYNLIGKVMNVFKVNGDSANLNIENLPSGIYFVRLFNSNGNVVVTRKFTKQ